MPLRRSRVHLHPETFPLASTFVASSCELFFSPFSEPLSLFPSLFHLLPPSASCSNPPFPRPTRILLPSPPIRSFFGFYFRRDFPSLLHKNVLREFVISSFCLNDMIFHFDWWFLHDVNFTPSASWSASPPDIPSLRQKEFSPDLPNYASLVWLPYPSPKRKVIFPLILRRVFLLFLFSRQTACSLPLILP